jgi:hydrogenase/urease accessory protein HupE
MDIVMPSSFIAIMTLGVVLCGRYSGFSRPTALIVGFVLGVAGCVVLTRLLVWWLGRSRRLKRERNVAPPGGPEKKN